MGSYRLGAFDFVDAFEETVEIAQQVERFGYSRFWLAEHVVGGDCSVQLPLTLLAGLTDSMRIGTAGVQIRFQNPELIARGFRFLESTFPGRIDAGFCGGGGKGNEALLRYDLPPSSEEDPFVGRATSLLAAMRGSEPIPAI